MHLSVMHNYASRTELFLPEIKEEPDEKKMQIESSNNPTVSEKIHDNEQIFTCKHCNRKFNKLVYLEIHQTIQNCEKPFSCKYCDKKFNKSRNVNSHFQ